jgi:hypothetical protein
MTTVVGMGRFDLLKGRGKGGSRLREGVEGAEGARDLGWKGGPPDGGVSAGVASLH